MCNSSHGLGVYRTLKNKEVRFVQSGAACGPSEFHVKHISAPYSKTEKELK